ncbi:response regulator [Dactylosporangium sp. McL0621]|uniref:response regulator n=1 Tax=Dactylosporangium sp. McL0621 TaxID=3415678 RepID=UPI003CF5717B
MIVDDQAVIRAGLRVLIDRDPDLTVVGEAVTGEQALELAASLQPDIVLMDIRMPGLDGIQATRQLRAEPRTSGIKVIVLTTFDTDEYVFDALRCGASGFLLKDADPGELRRAVHVVADGDALLTPNITRRLIDRYTRQPAEPEWSPAAIAGLTERETEVLGLVGRGLTNKDIAAHLRLSQATVKTHVSRAMTKLGAHDRAQLVIVAYECELVRRGERDITW